MKTPISQLVIDLNDIKRKSKSVEKAIKSQTTSEIDLVTEILSPFAV